MKKQKYDLEERLIRFTINVCELAENIDKTALGTYISNQIIRSGASPALNYAEAQSAESPRDFIHKLKIVLKELRETKVSLKIIKIKPLTSDQETVNKLLNETEELLAIFSKSVSTASLSIIKKKPTDE